MLAISLTSITVNLEPGDPLPNLKRFSEIFNDKFPGLRYERDLVLNQNSKGHIITGLNEKASTALALMARWWSLGVSRLDLTARLTEPLTAQQSLDEHYILMTDSLAQWYAKHRPTVGIPPEKVHWWGKVKSFGAKTSKNHLDVILMTDSKNPAQPPYLDFKFILRGEDCSAAWSLIFLNQDNQLEGISNSWFATANSLLAPGLLFPINKDLRLARRVNKEPVPARDFTGWLDLVAKRIVQRERETGLNAEQVCETLLKMVLARKREESTIA